MDFGVCCAICLKDVSKYSCPRCNIRYCSAACYKANKHAQCSESFYKDCFMQGLKECNTSDEERKKMLEILSRFENEDIHDVDDFADDDGDDDEDDDELSLEERLHGLDLDTDAEKILDILTPRERHDFEEMLNDGRISNIIESWEPYWIYKETSLVTEIGKEKTYQKHCPSLVKNILHFSTLIKSNVSPSIPFDMVNILYGYAYTARLYNGDHQTIAEQAAQVILDLSESLLTRNFNTLAEAIEACFTCLMKMKDVIGSSAEMSAAVLQDVEHIISGPSLDDSLYYVLSALSDIHKLLRTARKEIETIFPELGLEINKQNHSKNSKDLREKKKVLFQCIKKIEYLLGWTSKHGVSLLNLVPEIETIFCLKISSLNSHTRMKHSIESHMDKLKPASRELIVDTTPSRELIVDTNNTNIKQPTSRKKKVTFCDSEGNTTDLKKSWASSSVNTHRRECEIDLQESSQSSVNLHCKSIKPEHDRELHETCIDELD